MFWANGQFWSEHVFHRNITSRSLNPALVLTLRTVSKLCPPEWRNFFNLITHCCAGLCKTLLAVLVKTFPNRNLSRPTKFLRTLTLAPTLHSTQVFAQCVTSSTVSNSFLQLSLISFPSRVKINKLLDSRIHLSRVSRLIRSAFLTTLYWNCIGM